MQTRVSLAHSVLAEAADAANFDLSSTDRQLEYDRRNQHYQQAHYWCRVLLRGLGVRDIYERGSGTSFAFLFDMNVLFENFVSRIVEEASLMERSRRKRWALVALDVGVDTTTPQGEMVANVMASFAQFERKLIGQRTREALAVKRMNGVRLGRPPVLDEKVRQRIRRQRSHGRTLAAIAGKLNADAVPTAHGRPTMTRVNGAERASTAQPSRHKGRRKIVRLIAPQG